MEVLTNHGSVILPSNQNKGPHDEPNLAIKGGTIPRRMAHDEDAGSMAYLPPYRSLLTPHLKYDYQLHRAIELTSDELSLYRQTPYGCAGKQAISASGFDATKTQKIKMKYRSLLTDTKKKLFNSDLFSLSSTSAVKPILNIRKATFQDLPEEVAELVMWHLRDDQRTLVSCLYTSHVFYESALKSLYFNPQFTSTYRVGQFVTSLQENRYLARYVKILDLSKVSTGWDYTENGNDEIDIFQLVFNTDPGRLEELLNSNSSSSKYDYYDHPARAGWRDWKFRDNALYGRRPSANGQPLLSRQMTNTTLVSNGSFKYQAKARSRSNSDTTLIRPQSEFYDMYRNFENCLPSNSSSSSLSITQSLKRRKSRYKKIKNAILKRSSQQQRRKISTERDNCDETSADCKQAQSVTIDLKKATRKPYYAPFTEPHPYTNKFLNKYAVTKDLPIGYIVHMLSLCENLVELNLSDLSLSMDFRIIPNDLKFTSRQPNGEGGEYEKYIQTNGYQIQSLIPSIHEGNQNDEIFAPHYKSKSLKQMSRLELSQNLVFLSDLGINTIDHHFHSAQQQYQQQMRKESIYLHLYQNQSQAQPWRLKYRQYKNHRSIKLSPLDIIDCLSSLPHLKMFNARNCVWMDKKLVLKFLERYHGQHKNIGVNFVDTGMMKNSIWCIEGDVKALVRVFKNEDRLLRNWEDMYSLIHRIGENY